MRNMCRALRSLAQRFHRDRQGTIAVFIAAAAIPLIGAIGLATDVARGYLVKSRLHHALDAAALAGGQNIASSSRDTEIQKFFTANFPLGYMSASLTPLVITPSDNNTKLTVGATATVPTTFMRVFGFEDITVAAETQVARAASALDVVLSIDVSGSMGQPMSKIQAARQAAKDLVDVLYGSATTSPTYAAGGTTYNLINVGLVPWNSKVNITERGKPAYSTTATGQTTVSSYVDPTTGTTRSTVTYPNSSPSVPLFTEPASDWRGCVYARYNADGNNANDGDLSLALGSIGGAAWVAFEPIPTLQGEPRSGTWSTTEGPNGTRWYSTSILSQYRDRSCHETYWNDDLAEPIGSAPNTSRPSAVPAPPNPSGTAYDWHPAVPAISLSDLWSYSLMDCTACPTVPITPLQPSKTVIKSAIDELVPDGTTNIPQGLYWAAQVLMPGKPFDQAYASVPFPRGQAIVLLTDGENHGGNGDAYKGRFGAGEQAGTTTNAAHGFLPSPPAAASTRNNLNNRLLQLAANLRAMGILIYVVQFDNNTPTLTSLLKSVASADHAPYYYYAPTTADLQTAFQQIAADLSKLRIAK